MTEETGNISLELQRFSEITKVNDPNEKNYEKFQRNLNVSNLVHILLHFLELIVVAAIEIFHHVHHMINRHLREKNKEIPFLPGERSAIFFITPIAAIFNFILIILWINYKKFDILLKFSIVGCLFGFILMLTVGIYEMRYVVDHINSTGIPDYELIHHPIFIHSFVICIISIFALALYTMHFWLLYDQLKWIYLKRKGEKLPKEVTSRKTSTESGPSGSDSDSNTDSESSCCQTSDDDDDNDDDGSSINTDITTKTLSKMSNYQSMNYLTSIGFSTKRMKRTLPGLSRSRHF